MPQLRAALLGLLLGVWASAPGAAELSRFTPQGAMARIQQVQADFAAPAVALGNDAAPDPYQIQCDDPAAKGAGRWVDPQHWVFNFEHALTGAVSCVATPNTAFRDLQGQPLAAAQTYRFTTGGPRARMLRPWGDEIAEDQVFVLRFNADTDAQSLLDHSHCEVQGLGEAVPVRLVEGAARQAILRAIGEGEDEGKDDDARATTDIQLLQCKRLLPPKARVRLLVGPGVRTPARAGRPGVVSRAVLARDFKVRDAFQASLNCTRTHAQAPCSPLFPIQLVFSSPVPRALARQVVLQTPQGARVAQAFGADAQDDDRHQESLSSLTFAAPFPERSTLSLAVPQSVRDDMGRTLANAARFPLSIAVDAMPPLVKFSSGPFGIIERFAEGLPAQHPDALVPLAVRRVEPALQTRELSLSAGRVADHVTTDDVEALRWLAKVQRLQDGRFTQAQFADVLASRPLSDAQPDEAQIDARARSIFTPRDAARQLTLPPVPDADGPDARVIGVPVSRPGLHVLEVASPRLGAALLADAQHPAGETMYVRSAVLLTNLAVHLKTGRDDVLVWVTSLDDGKPVAGAQVAVLGCDGTRLAGGQTDADGVWHALKAMPTHEDCADTGQSGVFVTARVPADHPQAYGQADFSFAWSGWDQGIEPWRFDVPTSQARTPDQVAHAVLDRTLLRAGETVAMKLFLRTLDRDGVHNPDVSCLQTQAQACLPQRVGVVHDGSGDTVRLPVHWQLSASGGLFALLDYKIPETARLGQYSIRLPEPGASAPQAGDDPIDDWSPSLFAGSFRVEAFKLPVLTGSLKISALGKAASGAAPGATGAEKPVAPGPQQSAAAGDAAPGATGALLAPTAVQADLQLAWQSGGPARDLPASLSAVAEPFTPAFADYADFVFGADDELREPEAPASAAGLRHLILDKQPVQLDARGGARLDVTSLPPVQAPQRWRFEASFADPNGEIQTISQSVPVWPAAIVVGLQAGRWMSRGEQAAVKLVVLNPAGQPQAGVAVQLDGRVRTRYTTRKRLVGGFYAYDTHDQLASLGTLCQGKTNAQGVLECPVALQQDGEVQLFAQARDGQGRVSQAATSLWVWGGESWFGGGDNDRIDVIPSKASYKPGETAEFTVRMPFRQAQALVAVEREGVLKTQVVALSGDEPVVRVPIDAQWGPNVYVSVLAVRGRMRQVPWASLVDWGWRHPLDWWRAHRDQVADAPAPTGLVDLSKPSFRFGLAQVRVASEADRLAVEVSADRASYQVRGTAHVRIHASLPDGRPAAQASVAFVAVDEALLDLMPNDSWALLDAMRVPRDYGVETATAQGEVVGRRHYGRKAVPAGGGGGFGASRELFDTRLLWRGDLVLDAQGRGQLDVPLNDALTRFRLVAVVDHGQGRFGTGATDIVSTQDLQVVSGLPLLVREQDRYTAQATVRNRTGEPMVLRVSAQVKGAGGLVQTLADQTLELAVGASRTVTWPVVAPVLTGAHDTQTLDWTFAAQTRAGKAAADRVLVHQVLQAAVPVAVRQATLLPVRAGAPAAVPVQLPASALNDGQGVPRGGVRVDLQSSLAGTLPGVRDWLAAYPYACFEQLSAKALGMQDPAAWQALMARLPAYQAESGLLAYFPGGRGSVVLTAQLLEISAQAQVLAWPYDLPAPARERMLAALQRFVLGQLDEAYWAPMDDTFWRKLIAVDALVGAGAWQSGMLDGFALDVSDWPTPAVVTWLSILRQVPGLADREALLARADAVLRMRLVRHGTSLVIADPSADAGWWLMSNVATAQARLLMAVLPRPQWQADVPRLMTGLLSLQSKGAWPTTSANVLGVLAVNQYARRFETQAGQGAAAVSLPPGQPLIRPWAQMPEAQGVRRQSLDLPWPASRAGTVSIVQQGAGSGWATVTARAAVPPLRAQDAGLRVERSVVPVARARPDRWSAGDIYRVRLLIHSREPLVWTVVSDPVPAGASILGSGLGRDSALAVQQEAADQPWWDRPSFIERAPGMFRAYFEVLDVGTQALEYTVRLNTPGEYQLPPTRAEALYQPEIFGSVPNPPFVVAP